MIVNEWMSVHTFPMEVCFFVKQNKSLDFNVVVYTWGRGSDLLLGSVLMILLFNYSD